MRLDKFVSSQTGMSRSDVKKEIKYKHISVNGAVITSPDFHIDESKDIITINGKAITYEKHVYYLLNKPKGVVSAATDNLNKTVIDLIDDTDKRKNLFPVGRLDKDTEGLLIITNDGAFSHNLLSPSKHVDKTYFAILKGHVTNEDIKAFADGIDIGTLENPEPCKSAKLEIINYNDSDDTTEVYITISEGKFHQVKRMAYKIGCTVTYLKRISMGSFTLPKDLPLGKYIKLNIQKS